MESLKERLKSFAEYKGLSVRAFEEECGLTRGNVSNMKDLGALGSDKLSKIIDRFEDIDVYWLITGKGEMLKTKRDEDSPQDFTENTEIKNPPIIPTSLSRRQNVDILEIVQESTDGMEICPVRVDDLPISVWHRVRDNSLEPELRKDDKIALHAYQLGEEDPMPGLLYGINTRTNGMILRRLYPHPDGYIGRSYNREDFPDVVIPYNNIIRIYRALLQVRTL